MLDIPAWVIIQHAPVFTQPTIGRDPAVAVLAAPPAFELAAYIITRDSAKIFFNYQVVGPPSQVWSTENVADPLQALGSWLVAHDIRLLAVNSDTSDPRNDGLSASLARRLSASTQCKFCSAGSISTALWRIKTPKEVEILTRAQHETAVALEELGTVLRVGWEHSQIAQWLRIWCASRNFGSAWGEDWVIPPIVGIGSPDDNLTSVTAGHTMYVDYSISVDGFCSDLQRTYYMPMPGEDSVPSKHAEAFAFGMASLDQMRQACRPGKRGYELFAIGAELIEQAGYTFTFPHIGHPIGRSVNTTGAILEPRSVGKERTESEILSGEVYSLVLRFRSKDKSPFVIAIEEIVYVGEEETTYISPLQPAIWLLSPQ